MDHQEQAKLSLQQLPSTRGQRRCRATIIAAGPSNAATDNLLDRLAANKGKPELGRLGDNQSVFAESRKQFSLTLQASWGEDFGTVKRHVLNGRVRKIISEGKHHALFSTYMKSAWLGSCNTCFLLADEAGQATQPTAAILMCNAAPGGHVFTVGDEHQLPPTVRDRNADWDGLSISFMARLNRTHEGTDHLITLEIQFRMHRGIQRFPNIQYCGGLLRCGLRAVPEMIAGIPWPATRNDAPKDGKEISDEVDGAFVADGKPTHWMIFVHCHGAEVTGNSPTNPMQVEAAEYIFGLTAAKNRTTTQTLVLSPYRAQVDLLTGRLGRSGNKAITVSTVDAAQGQEADLVIISFVRANSSGKVGYTDDARRLNVAATRAKVGVVIIGHLATSLAASSSGFRRLLHDLKMQGGIFEYGAPGAREYLRKMSNVDYVYVRQDPGGHPDHSPRAKSQNDARTSAIGSGSLGNLDSKKTWK